MKCRCIWIVTTFIILSLFSCRTLDKDPTSQSVDCALTSTLRSVPEYLSETCLYLDISQQQISSKLRKFTPNYQLWSDFSNKSRWIYLPPNSQINTDNPDQWVFPVGTQVFKEFKQVINNSDKEIIVETRHLQKITPGTGIDSWLISSYLWNAAQDDAKLSQGASNVLNTDHDIPSEQDCMDCHMGNTDILLGFDAIQLSDKQGELAFGFGRKRQSGEWTLSKLTAANLLTKQLAMPVLPGNSLDQQALGYLHANCGNCHNPLGLAAQQDAKHLKFRHQLAFDSLEKTDVYTSAVNQKTQNFTAVPYIILGAENEELALYQSAVFIRMHSTDENYRMPMLAREKVDYQAIELFQRWFKTLQTPADAHFTKDHRKTTKSTTSVSYADRSKSLEGPGLQVEIQFFNDQYVPPVVALYWPEDTSLANKPVVDHKDGFFTNKLIVGNKGSIVSLRNSDDVGHTIYVKDKVNDVKWQLNYMPPGSEFKQELFWQEDTFVEMKCRLHLYMSSWIGSIKSKYHKIVELEDESYKLVTMQNYPEHFKQLKIWLPKFDLISTTIDIGQQQSFDLVKEHKKLGKITIKRSKQ